MTSKQVMLTALTLMGLALAALLNGCAKPQPVTLEAPYESRQVWAVAPLRNESGTAQASGVTLADKLARRLETARGIEVLPVNRVLAAMEQAGLRRLDSRKDALAVLDRLGADGLLLGSISAWEPYEPLKLGLSLELYVRPARAGRPIDVRRLSKAATGGASEPKRKTPNQPVSAISAFYNAADPTVRRQMKRYAENRGGVDSRGATTRLYRISMDLYSEFVSYAMLDRLLDAERTRVTTKATSPNATQPAS